MTLLRKRVAVALSLVALAALIAAPKAVGGLAKQIRPWDKSTIHYVVDTTNPCNGKPAVCGSCSGLTNVEAVKVRDGLDELEAYTPLKFVPGIAIGGALHHLPARLLRRVRPDFDNGRWEHTRYLRRLQ